MDETGSRIDVLYVDDDPDVRDLTATCLERQNDRIHVRTTPDGQSTLSLLASTSVDCVVSDFDLPTIDGLELLDRIHERHTAMPFILFTARESDEVASRAIAAGATDYIQRRAGMERYELLATRICFAVEKSRTDRLAVQHETQALTLIEASPHAILVLHEGEFTYLNGAGAELLGVPADALIDSPFLSTVHRDDRRRVTELLESARTDPKVVSSGEWRMATDDGSTVNVDGTCRTIPWDGRRCVLVTARDVTEEKAREEALVEKNDRLRKVTSILSHDLRNPLSVARARTQIARETGDIGHLDAVEAALDRMLAILDDSVVLAKQGSTSMSETEFLLSRPARSAWSNIETAAATLDVVDDGLIVGDETQMNSLFENLFRNAVTHGGSDVAVRVGRTEGGFYVEDTGTGIPADSRDSVFEHGVSLGEKGTGYGLFIVAQITDDHGWRVSLDESEEGGARFEFCGLGAT